MRALAAELAGGFACAKREGLSSRSAEHAAATAEACCRKFRLEVRDMSLLLGGWPQRGGSKRLPDGRKIERSRRGVNRGLGFVRRTVSAWRFDVATTLIGAGRRGWDALKRAPT